MNPYPTPLSFHPAYAPQPGGSPAPLYFPYQQAVPAQRVQSSIVGQSHAYGDPNPLYNESPSAEQYTAAAILQAFHSDTILAWLKGIRSYLRGEGWFDPGLLSPQQYQAVLTLIDYRDDALLILLNLARSPGQYLRTI